MKWLKKTFFISFAVIVLFAFFFEFQKEKSLLLKERPSSWTQDVQGDCGIVLTGGRGRVAEGVSLLVTKRIKKLIISGVYEHSHFEDIFPQWPFYEGLHFEDVILEKHSKTTYGNAQQSWPFVEALRCQSVLLITSYLHMPRARRTFMAVYPKGFPIYTHSIPGGHYPPPLSDLYIETIKSLFYSLWAY